MDVGVGYFIMCHSMRLIRNSADDSEHSKAVKSKLGSLPRKLIATIRKSSIILFFGFLRLFLVKFFNYQVAVGEYGLN